MTSQYLVKDLTIEITRKCPMGCTICSSEGGESDPAELSFVELCKVIDDAKQLGATTISLSGGEPLESPHAFDFIRYVKKAGLTLNLYTCGNIYSENRISAIKEETFRILQEFAVDKIIFSIHGPNAEIHEKITTKTGSFDNLITSIKRAQEYGHNVELHFVPVLSNFEYIPQTCHLATELGIQQMSMLRFVPQGRGAENREKLEIKDEKIEVLKNILQKIYSESTIQIRLGAPFNCFNIDNQTQCTAGIDKAIVRPDGFVFPCVSMKRIIKETNLINLRLVDLIEIWNNSYYFTLSRQIIENENFCSNCQNNSICKGGCITQKIIGDSQKEMDLYCRTHIIRRYINSDNKKQFSGCRV